MPRSFTVPQVIVVVLASGAFLTASAQNKRPSVDATGAQIPAVSPGQVDFGQPLRLPSGADSSQSGAADAGEIAHVTTILKDFYHEDVRVVGLRKMQEGQRATGVVVSRDGE